MSTKVAILSKDAQYYGSLLQHTDIHGIELVCTTDKFETTSKISQAEVLLAEPNLAAPHLSNFPNLKWMQSTWAGNRPLFDHPRNDYQLTGIKGIFGPLMSEFIFAYILYFHRKIPQFNTLQNKQKWCTLPIASLQDKTIGILGVGSIGAHVAKTAKHFNMTVLGLSRKTKSLDNVDVLYQSNELTKLASKVDYLVNLLPDTPHTQHIINHEILAELPNHCVIINAGRGNGIEQSALISALNSEQILGAVLDVFEQEPLPQNHPFYQTKNLYITNHSAAVSFPDTVFPIFKDNLLRYLANQPLSYPLDFTQGY
jgi:phosphoglycerate dehydrogenase-like enzyme